jgi:hypothetical protein
MASTGRAVHDVVPDERPLSQSRSEQRQGGQPRATTSRCTSPRHEGGRRRAIGGVAVFQSATARPRRWCDAGPPRADQKAAVTGSHGNGASIPRVPVRHTTSRIRDSYRCETEGAGVWRPPGVPSLTLFLMRLRSATRDPNNVKGGNHGQPPSGAPVPATREAAGVPSAWSQSFNSPPRDHADGATLGRLRRTRRPGFREATMSAMEPSTVDCQLPSTVISRCFIPLRRRFHSSRISAESGFWRPSRP